MKFAVLGRHAFDRPDLAPVRLDRERQARQHARPIDEDGAGTAAALVATEFRVGQAEPPPQQVDQRDPGGIGQRNLASTDDNAIGASARKQASMREERYSG